MADVSGSTTYGYDTRNRLTSKQTPFGTLSYTYDSAGDLLSLKSSNTGGASDTYTYDQLDRLSTVTDTSGATTYSYDAVGNLQNFTYPNGVAHSYAYDTLNRLTQVGAAKAGTPQSSYAYTLGAAGNRLTVAELSGRNVAYGYDSLYRLTSETVTADPHSNNFVNGFVYDAVGNRKQWLVNGLVTNTYTYDADDRLGSDQYDADGNTTNSLGVPSSYDFENHLIQKGAVTVVYDGDGNRVAETVGGATTNYLVDTQNPTGYAQVVDELQSGTVTRTYSYGLERINENQVLNSAWTASFYGYDGHGSVRQLTNSSGAVTDTYDYDAFGNLINSTGTTPNNYLFAGEQYDPALSLYYNRARYYNNTTGRFWSMDTYEGETESPSSLHKYLYAGANPVDGIDPSGNDFDLGSVTTALGIAGTLSAISNVLVAGAISAAYGSYPDAVAFGVFGAGEITGIGANGSLAGIGGYEIVFAPRLKQERSFWWGGFEPSIGAPISPSDFGHLAHGRHREAGIFIAWYWNLDDLEPGNFGLYAITAGTGFYGFEFTPEGATASLTGQILYNSGVSEVGLFSIGGGEIPGTGVTSASEGTMATGVAASEAAFTAIGTASSGGAVNPTAGAAASVLNAGVGALWVHYTYGRPR